MAGGGRAGAWILGIVCGGEAERMHSYVSGFGPWFRPGLRQSFTHAHGFRGAFPVPGL